MYFKNPKSDQFPTPNSRRNFILHLNTIVYVWWTPKPLQEKGWAILMLLNRVKISSLWLFILARKYSIAYWKIMQNFKKHWGDIVAMKEQKASVSHVQQWTCDTEITKHLHQFVFVTFQRCKSMHRRLNYMNKFAFEGIHSDNHIGLF